MTIAITSAIAIATPDPQLNRLSLLFCYVPRVSSDAKSDTASSGSTASGVSAVSAASGAVSDVSGGVSGHVVLYIRDVSTETARTIVSSPLPLLGWGLLQHERKVSVLHFQVQRHPNEYNGAIKGKDEMQFHVGFRRFSARPVYSQVINNCDKNVGQRFMQTDQFCIATVYARIMFPPFNVLMFLPPAAAAAAAAAAATAAASTTIATASASTSGSKPPAKSVGKSFDDKEMSQAPPVALSATAAASAYALALPFGSGAAPPKPLAPLAFLPLVASGTLHSVDPARCIIKRIVLSGYPVSCHKRMAVIKYMFYRPEDIRWFKPVEVQTKNGLTGHIREPRGTKGYMKCNFSDFIKSNDTVRA